MANFYGQFIGFGAGGEAAETFHGGGSAYGYCVGGYPPVTDTIQKYSYASDGDAVDAGQNMDYTGGEAGTCSSATYGYVMIQNPAASSTGTYRKFQFNTSNDMTTVANLSTGTTARGQLTGTMSSTYGYAMGGGEPTEIDVVDKFSFASEGDATDVGNLTQSRRFGAGTCSSTYGYYAGGHSAPPYWNIIDKFPFASDTNSADVGDLLSAKGYMNSGNQSSTYGYCAGGVPNGDVIQKWSYASDANATDVGDLLDSVNSLSCTSSLAYGYRNGGSPPPYTDRIDKWDYASDGHATDVGNLLVAAGTTMGCQY